MKRTGLYVLLVMLVSAGLVGSAVGKDYKDISATELRQMMEQEQSLVVFPLSRIEFNDRHIAGSVNIPLSRLPEGLPADKSRKVVFYCLGIKCTASWRAAEKAVEAGYENVYAFREGLPAWEAAGYPTETVEALPDATFTTISPAQLNKRLMADTDTIILDIRLRTDADKFWIDHPSRIYISMDEMLERYGEIPKGKTIAVLCLKGKRSPTVIRFLAAKGFDTLLHVEGGIQQWMLEGLPVVARK
ncbi:MAG: hypothetical protein GWO11_01770 [Desulfuromonadales bacterium]|nr:hypothetical protein [Desulfuromonadales bacterium]NIR33223.1 hypothetical protein [Desulfuromonadales bacterium]NIS40727.1 hypothetical protein [Desulfuromonadales bacterium]